MTTRNGLRALPQISWNRVERGLAALGLLVLVQAWTLPGAWYALGRPDRDRLIRVDMVEVLLPGLVAFLAGATLLAWLGLALRRRRLDSLLFQHACAQYYVLGLSWIGYFVGTQSFVAGVALIGSALTGYILLERAVVRAGFATGLLVVVGLTLASAFGELPYAPALRSPQDAAGALFWTHATLYLAAPQMLTCIVATAAMLGLWRRREKYVVRLGLTDVLTRVHNRRAILEALGAALAAAQQQGRPLAVALLDLDHFKRINDTWGHPTGDRVLKEAARVLKGCLREVDGIGRFGGEEFLLVLPGLARAEAEAQVERCRAELAALVVTADSGERIPVSASFGLAWCAQPGGSSVEALVQAADAQLYAAKLGGRNRVVLLELPAESGARPVAAAARVMREAPPPRKSRLLRLVREFLNGWQTWTPVDRQMFHLGLSIALFGNFLLWVGAMLLLPGGERIVNMALQEPVVPWLYVIQAGFLLLIGVGLLIRRRWPASRLYLVVCQQYFAVTLTAMGYFVGMLSFATGIMLVGLPLVAFIYFDRRIVWWSLTTPIVMTVVLAYASALGALPYAPTVAAGLDRHQPHDIAWVLSYFHFTWATIAVIMVLADQTIGRWRVRGEQVVALSRTDMLTQVENRRAILAQLDREVARARETGAPLTVVLLDIDHFKRINDTWGHPTGDRVLKEAAQLLRGTLREGDSVGRYGGEEFLMLLPATPPEGAAALMERCRARLAATVVTADNGANFFISASFGVAGLGATGAAPGAEADGEALIRVADAALYRAKDKGRNRIEVAAPA